jgi:hypothetical protein
MHDTAGHFRNELKYCRSCTAEKKDLADDAERAIRKPLEEEDAVVLKTVLSQFKSESLKKLYTAWFTTCRISEHDTVEPAAKKTRVEE